MLTLPYKVQGSSGGLTTRHFRVGIRRWAYRYRSHLDHLVDGHGFHFSSPPPFGITYSATALTRTRPEERVPLRQWSGTQHPGSPNLMQWRCSRFRRRYEESWSLESGLDFVLLVHVDIRDKEMEESVGAPWSCVSCTFRCFRPRLFIQIYSHVTHTCSINMD